ncbi:GNAT family N-acetyltransferase [Streptomyces mexicanus]|uniref:GNAT family N-acetyltransferase n=1 Tax=Streptomyces mexicanus TaxID=178566 RepID=UPI00365AA96B
MKRDKTSAPTVEAPGAGRRPVARAAAPADAEGIVRLHSAYVLSEPLSEEWIRRCTTQLAPRLATTGDARAYVIDAPDGSMAACALGLIHSACVYSTDEDDRPLQSQARRSGVAACFDAWDR